jgi:CMP-N,N'-diacetyllegionaminic acid synthase
MIEVPFMRPSHLSADHTPTVEVIKHALNYFARKGNSYDTVCLLQPTCPFRSAGFADKCIKAFIDSGADCLFSVKRVPHEFNPHWVFTPGADGFLQISTGDESIIPNRQLLPPAYARDGSVYVFKAENILLHNNLYGKSISYLESDSPWHVNIDTAEDWKQAEKIAVLKVA